MDFSDYIYGTTYDCMWIPSTLESENGETVEFLCPIAWRPHDWFLYYSNELTYEETSDGSFTLNIENASYFIRMSFIKDSFKSSDDTTFKVRVISYADGREIDTTKHYTFVRIDPES